MDGDVLALDLSERKINYKTCEHCGSEFPPRNGSGGSRQRFCSSDCRGLFHKSQRSQRAPACTPQPKPENAPRATQEPSGDFSWDDAEAVVLHEQPETAVYWNPNGDLVIRQRRHWPDDDVWVVITGDSVDRFLDKLTDICGIPSVGGPA
jgi:hypothetical protein